MELVELGTILHMEKGKKPQQQVTEAREGFLPYVDIKAFEQGIIDNYASTDKCLLCEDGDLLIVCDGSRSGLTGRAIKGVVGSTLSKISADGVINEYLRYFIQSKYTLLNTRKKGTGTPHLNADILKKSKLVVPSEDEQKRMVSRIEELFSQIDEGLKTLKKTKTQLAIYKQSVLNTIFHSYDSYEECLFGDLMEVVRNGYGKKPDDEGMYKILTIGSLRMLNLDLSNYRLNKSPFDDVDLIQENDLLFTRYNGSKEFVGVCSVVLKINEDYAYPDKLIKFRPKIQDKDYSKFLAYYASGGEGRLYLRSKIKTTSGQNGIAGSDIKKMKIRIPDMETIKKIVYEVETRLSACENIENTVDTLIVQSESMKLSILRKEFEGGVE